MQSLRSPPEGLLGGSPGAPARVLWNGRELGRAEAAALTGAIELGENDTLTIDTAGGGGFGEA